jgi:hypothetical protein
MRGMSRLGLRLTRLRYWEDGAGHGNGDTGHLGSGDTDLGNTVGAGATGQVSDSCNQAGSRPRVSISKTDGLVLPSDNTHLQMRHGEETLDRVRSDSGVPDIAGTDMDCEFRKNRWLF